ncbi:N-acylneuraminate cytidylyltransferase [Diorhabda sublineata]|uniref:N-acylneuraminate cytidylyltransferase n=1 Tax=Diorhabda sublineata TaxID=1163346 RepID=UPI0024E1948E|nr:N-acylneuraminate cytidylyltransferase [Diorhabda sublineata]
MKWKFLYHILILYTVITFGYCCNKYNWNPFLTKTSPHLAILILARGGSKGVHLKNIAKVNNIPLIRISLDSIKNVNFVHSVWVSTDHINIFQEAEEV